MQLQLIHELTRNAGPEGSKPLLSAYRHTSSPSHVHFPAHTTKTLAPLPSLGLQVASWWLTIVLFAGLHYTNTFKLSAIIDNFGSYLTVAVVAGDVITVATYVICRVLKQEHYPSGNVVYDMFMGIWLNPRIGILDLKMFAEIRISWILLFAVTAGSAVKQYEDTGHVTTSMMIMVLAHFLYTNACMKGEECIPTTWDIFHERWGFMLIFWNFAGVPFAYTFQSVFLYFNKPTFEHPPLAAGLICVVLLVAYYIWDTANSQKNHFRMKDRGTYIKRHAFPQLPWRTLDNPSFIQTKQGNKLLTGGWWAYARKIPYTCDMCMALCWGLTCGFTHFLPYFYYFFFTGFITHRMIRDQGRCAKKYGKDWDRYTGAVPYIFIPGVI